MTLVLLASLSAGVLQDQQGNVLSKRQVNVYARGTSTPVQVYADSAGSSPVTQPLTSDSSGQVPGYVAGGVSIDIVDVLTGLREQGEPLLANLIVSKEAPVNPMHPSFGAKFDGSTIDTTALQAALTYAATAGHTGGVGEVYLPAGATKIDALVTVPLGVGMRGEGSSLAAPASKILCSNAAAGVVLTPGPGKYANFAVDGNGVATSGATNAVLAIGTLAVCGETTFDHVHVLNGGQDNWLIQQMQNTVLLSCGSQNAARDNLVLDKGCGGLLFPRFESNGSSRYSLRIINSAGTGPYPLGPTHNTFKHSIFERNLTDVPTISCEKGGFTLFDDCVIAIDQGTTTPMVDLTSTASGPYEFRSCIFSDTGGRPSAIRHAATAAAALAFTGVNVFNITGAVIDNVANKAISEAPGSINLGTSATLLAGGSGVSNISAKQWLTRFPTGQTTASIVDRFNVAGDVGDRFRNLSVGAMQWGDGTGFTFDCVLQRNGTNLLAVLTSDFAVSTAGRGLRVKEGSNCKQGTATLAAGTVVVSNTAVTANSRILLTSNADGGTPGWLRVSARSAGTSFTITSSSGTDTSTVAYQIFEPG